MKILKRFILTVVIMVMIGCNSKPMDEVKVTSYVNVDKREYTIILPVPTVVPTMEQEEVIVIEEEKVIVTYENFPFVSQNGSDAPQTNDCGSAAMLMVAQYYGVDNGATVHETHLKIAEGYDAATNYKQVKNFIQDEFGLSTVVITTYEPIITSLEENGYDTSDIVVVDEVPSDVPIIWIYLIVPHWVVRFDGYNFDPLSEDGAYKFETTAIRNNMYKPELGLGIIVYKEKNIPTTQPK